MDVPWTERELRRLIVKACDALSRRNLVAATDGNVITARLSSDRVLVTPSGVSKGEIGELDVMLCDMDGRKIRGRGEISSEVHVHLAIYRAREDLCGVVHAHPPVASAFTFAGVENWLREPVIPEVVAQIGPIPSVPYIQPGSRALAEAVGAKFKECDIVMMAQHGAATGGKDPWAAYLRMEKLEHAAIIIKTARELAASEGKSIRTLSEQQVRELRAGYGKGKLSGGTESNDETAIVERIAKEVLNRMRSVVRIADWEYECLKNTINIWRMRTPFQSAILNPKFAMTSSGRSNRLPSICSSIRRSSIAMCARGRCRPAASGARFGLRSRCSTRFWSAMPGRRRDGFWRLLRARSRESVRLTRVRSPCRKSRWT